MNSAIAKPLPIEAFEQEEVFQKKKYGTFMGAYIPSILMLFGVVIFLRLGWITGVAGFYATFSIITLASLIIFITMLSLSAAATNIQVGKGGSYYMVSRAFGAEIGSAVGFSLFLKQSISTAFSVVGFSESFHGLFPQFSTQMIGLAVLACITLIAYISTNFVLKMQIFIFAMIAAGLYSLFAGGGDAAVVHNSLGISEGFSFWMIFSIFFPAMTGLESSLSLSGELKNPSRSLPIGVLSAVLSAYGVYILIAFFLWNQTPRAMLIEDKLIIQHVAKFESLIILGIWGATLSSAIGSLLGAPRTLQALAEDRIVPTFLGKEFGANREPRIATTLTVAIALVGVWFGSINIIAPILTMICLISYCTLNLATGLEDLMANPSWRPTFPSHWSVSFTGALLCIIAMLMINAGAALLAVVGMLTLYTIQKKKKKQSSWEDIRYGILMFFSRLALYRLEWQEEPSSRSWRPNFLVFTGKPLEVSNDLLTFASAITQTKGFLTVASVVPKEHNTKEKMVEMKKSVKAMLKKRGIEALVCLNEASHFLTGMKRVISHYGLGPLTPDTVVCGGISQENILSYLEIVRLTHDLGRNVVVINDEPQKCNPVKASSEKINGQIHVWWDESSPRNTELMLVLAYMLRKKSLWGKSNISLLGIADDEQTREMKQEKFNEFISRNRLNINIRIFVSSTKDSAEKLKLVEHFSSDASMIFLSLRPLHPDETLEEYEKYFRTLPHKSSAFPPVALVMCAEQTNLQEVVQIEANLQESCSFATACEA